MRPCKLSILWDFHLLCRVATTAGRGYWIRTSGRITVRGLANRWIKPLSQSSINDKPRQHTPLSCHCGLQLVSEPVVGFFPPRNVGRFGELSFSIQVRVIHALFSAFSIFITLAGRLS